ncbi:MAG: 3',5'-cyclic-AMP phosphodiesterase [Enterobacteriaceae bacterium]
MESLFNPPVMQDETIKVLQLTDTHLFATKQEILLGVNTYHSYNAVLQAIVRQQEQYDLVVATGDLAQDHSPAAYQHFAEGIRHLQMPCVWLPGNHDFQPVMAQTFASCGISPCKQVLLGRYWQLILLDSQVHGVAHGELSDYQLEWLQRCLDQYPERQVLLLLHHHPVAAGCSWLDQLGLRNGHMLAEVVKRYPQIRALLCGHIHQELDMQWHGARLLAAPSTCIQFKPHSTNFSLDRVAPGWRSLELYADGSFHTEVHRLASNEFMPDMESNGY